MCEVPSCAVSNLGLFASDCGETPENIFGNISRDGMWSWIAHGALLEVFSVQTKARCAVYHFGAKCRNSSLAITAIKEFSSPHLSFPCLLVGLDSVRDGGLLCIVNVKTSKVISSIQLPYKLTSLEIVSNIGGAAMETHMLNNQLRYLFGIAAVGTEGGNVFLVDLCLDAENYTDESMPNKAAVVSKTVHSLPAKREAAAANNKHICVFLNDNNFSCDTFEYRNGSTLLAKFSPGDVIVSALKYIRNIAVLVVGFNFGGIQLWNLQHMILEISIPIHANQQPLVYFAFQEPENDPRNFCYLWAIRGHYQGENYRPENASMVTLYAMAYSKREWIPRYGYFYEALQSCTKRFEYVLTSNPFNPSVSLTSSHCSRLITCDVLSQTDLLSRLEIDDPIQSEEWGSTEDIGLCLIAWENWPTVGKKPSSSYLALFDINQWYQAQMPSFLRCNHSEGCSYVGMFSLKEVSRKMDLLSILAISLVPNSLSQFKSSSVAEETFFPSSLSFKIWCTSTRGVLQATYLGAQRQLLQEMNVFGPNILLDPKKLYNRCVKNGLFNNSSVASPVKQATVAQQREMLLTLALEHNMIQFLSRCVQSWKHTEFIHTGCSSKFMLDWLWKSLTETKTSIDKLCLPLFNCSGQSLSENSLITLHIYKSRLKSLSHIIRAFQNLGVPQTEQGQQELQLRRDVIEYISVYLNVVLWLYDCKLLPEHPEGDEYGEDEVAYPVALFSRMYMYRRTDVQKIPCSLSEQNILLIDGLVDQFGESLGTMWEKKGGSKVYPPPSIYAAVSSYLIDSISLPHKHMLMYYLLLDMAAYLSDRQSHLLEKLSVFCPANDVSPSLNKLTQAFWYLDHQNFETAISILVDPMISSSEISTWQHVRIIKSFLLQEEPQKALKYINFRTPPEDTKDAMKLHLSVLVANGLICDAFFYLRKHQDNSSYNELLTHIFLGCQETHALDALLHLPLNLLEGSALSEFLHTCHDPKAPELLVMFHLLRCQPLEASNLNEKLISQVMERSSKCKERTAARNALVSGFVDTLPEEQKKIAKELNQVYFRLTHREVAVNPQPLSANVTSKALTSMSYADLLKNVIGKVADSATDVHVGSQTPFGSRYNLSSTPFLRPAVTPGSRKRKCSIDYAASPIADKLSTNQIESDDFCTPVKRARSFDIRSFLLSDKKPRSMKTPLHACLASLLSTPPVSRIPSSARASSTMMDAVSHTTPLSILKTKISCQGTISPSPSEEHLYCKTPSICSEASKDEHMSENDVEISKKVQGVQPRHLRFLEPTVLEPVQSNRSCRVSPRRPIHEEDNVEPIPSLDIIADGHDHVNDLDSEEVTPSRLSEEDIKPEPLLPMETELVHERPFSNDEDIKIDYSDSDRQLHNKSSESSSSNVEVMFDSRTNVVIDIHNSDSCNSDEVMFLNVVTERASDSALSTSGAKVVESDCSFHSVSNGDPIISEILPVETENFDACCDSIQKEAIQLDLITPQEKEDSSSPYQFTRSRSRSKSVSPSRSTSEISIGNVIPKSVALFTVADIDQKINKDFPEKESGVPLLEAELPFSGSLSPKKKHDALCETPRYSRQSRSKSSSPSRNPVPKSSVISESKSLSAEVDVPIKKNNFEVSPSVEEEHPFEVNSILPGEAKTDEENIVSKTPLHRRRSKSQSPPRTRRKDLVVEPQSSSLGGQFPEYPELEIGCEIVVSAKEESFKMEIVDHSTSSSTSNHQETPSHAEKVTSKRMGVTYLVQEVDANQCTLLTPKVDTEEKTKMPSSKLKSSKKKSKTKSAKRAEKMVFSFSNPHTSADAEVLEALYSTPSAPVAEFVFSPPASRTRNRLKNSGKTQIVSRGLDSSLMESKKTDVAEGSSENKAGSLAASSSSLPKSSTRIKKKPKGSAISSPQNYINFISPVVTSAATPEKGSKSSVGAKHTMTLRKDKKTVKLF